ncbi:hypothetical protein B0T44_08490 [Nocardia donostiensis]|uniref:Uncharacterized protein n=1 Tax=Nocardia donostiensis TaxID=1538463 RepID=A0A1W0BFG5_9NOCA|nr:hypothetical protein B0T46_18560 [Nocardia donostiensis]OQS21056.1 hypothetical protein B0T44_08490 [Nocardia donostiensis]
MQAGAEEFFEVPASGSEGVLGRPSASGARRSGIAAISPGSTRCSPTSRDADGARPLVDCGAPHRSPAGSGAAVAAETLLGLRFFDG